MTSTPHNLQPSRQPPARLWMILAAALVCILAALALLLALHWPFTEPLVTNAIGNTFSGTVTFTSFHSTQFPSPGCVAEGVVFRRFDAPPDSPPLAIAEKLTVQTGYFDLVLRPGYISRIVLTGLRLQVPAIGTTNQVMRNSAPSERSQKARIGTVVADQSVLDIARRDGNPPLRFEIHSLTLGSVTSHDPFSYSVALRNALPPGEIVAKGAFGPWNSADPGETPVSGESTFNRADLGVFDGIQGMLSSDQHFGGVLGHIQARGFIDIPDFSVTRSHHAVHLTSHFQAIVDGTNGDVTLQNVDASFLRTRVTASGKVASQRGVDGKVTSVDFSVTNGRIQDVLRLVVAGSHAPLNGDTSFRAHAVVLPEGRPFLRELHLLGDFGVVDAHFSKPDTQSSVDALSQSASGQKPSKDQNDEPVDPDQIVSNLFGHVEVNGGVANLSDFSFTVPSASATMHGTYNLLNENVDLHGTLKTDASLSQDTSGLKSVLLKPFNPLFRRKKHGAVIPVKLTGTYHDPHPGVDVVP